MGAFRTSLSVAPAAVLAAVLSAVALAVSASGADGANIVRCVGTESLAYSPGLTDTPATTTLTITTILSPCVSAMPLWTGAATSFRTNPPGLSSCLDLLRSGSASKLLTWSDGTTSTFSYNSTANRIRGQLVYAQAGTITAGRYKGSTGLGTFVGPSDLTACSTPSGLTGLTGVYTLDIVL
jgi:hypothetical protein